ncbi:MAG: hypothetical protein HC812_18300 [Leptolyngbya sp. RL_3_1]|nr:hypothetical protein [Leptolyngbya sp. RL_3_1]
MPTLTLDLATSATLLGTEPEVLLRFIQREAVPGVLFFEPQPQVSVFTLAHLLNTTPEVLMDWIEDEALATLMEAVEADEWYEGEEAYQAYQAVLAEAV